MWNKSFKTRKIRVIMVCIMFFSTFAKILCSSTNYTTSRWWKLKYFFFTPKIGEDSHFDEHIFQLGWFNHQLDFYWISSRISSKADAEGRKTTQVVSAVFALLMSSWTNWKDRFFLHPGRLTAGTYQSPMKRKANDLNQTSMRTCSMLIFRGVTDLFFVRLE